MIPKIKILGVGGSGSNTVSRIAKFNIQGVDLIAANTDAQALHFCKVATKILIGKNTTKGLGAGMDVEVGRAAAEESKEEIIEALKGSDIVFVTCGLGGGTGSSAAPIIAKDLQTLGILTVVVVTMPFSFEGEQRRQIANKAIEELEGKVDSLLIVHNDKLLKVIDEKTTVSNAFEICDDILGQAVQSITNLILFKGVINIDFSSIVSVIRSSGRALFGTAVAGGDSRAVTAATKAINSPLLDFSIKGSKGILLSASGNDLTLNEVKEAVGVVMNSVDSKAKVVFGALKDDSLKKGEIKVTVIATKF